MILGALIVLTVVALSEASPYNFPASPENVTGQIVKLKGSWVCVEDERGIDTYRFWAHVNELKDFQVGDRVRVYFYRNNAALISIRKMTPEACTEGQNLGVVSGCRNESAVKE